jgi:hypothetical protein
MNPLFFKPLPKHVLSSAMHGEGRENRRFGRGEVSYKSTQKSDFTKKVRNSDFSLSG